MPDSFPYERLVVVLIRPSKYDDDGYVIRHLRGTLPSNTLSCLHSLTDDAIRRGALDGLAVQVEVIDEIVSRVAPRRIARKHRGGGTKIVVGLVGVQTNQFPRAQDLARQFRAEGCDVLIGGFHVSGAMSLAPTPPPECQAMLDARVTLVLGEVEDHWADLLRDVARDRLQPVYNFLSRPPALTDKPLPRASFETQKKFVLAHGGTIDAGRGCPFNCSFCTIINVQGRAMRARRPDQILAQIRENYHLKDGKGIRHYFFTDDNFTRNPHWEEIFDGLIEMHEVESRRIDFMMQVDTQASKVPNFIEKAARAGCVQVFIGMESLRAENLKAVGKPQNKTAEYGEMIARWHAVGVICHVGYIIGFPNDTYERVMEDVRALRETLLVDQASFFMLTPLPGSRDHLAAVKAGLSLDPDYNKFDSFHAAAPHPKMSVETWQRAFRDAWREFYSFEHMRVSLLRQNPHTYWALLKNLIWYRAAMAEGAHPMIAGFVRLKDRLSRRPGFPIEGRWVFFWRRVREHAGLIREYTKIGLEMQELWLRTRICREEYAFLGEWRQLAENSARDLKINWGRLHAALDERLAELRSSAGSHVHVVSAAMAARAAALQEALGRGTSALNRPVANQLSLSAVGRSLIVAGSKLRGGRRVLDTLFADLRSTYMPHLPPAPRSAALRRVAGQLNPFALRTLEARREHVKEYWQQAWLKGRRLELWRLNPASLIWNFARDARHALLFFYAMLSERY